jgi:hypothetical protein
MQMSGLRADASAGWVFGALDELIPRQVWSADPHIGRDSSTACPVSQGKRTSPVCPYRVGLSVAVPHQNPPDLAS